MEQKQISFFPEWVSDPELFKSYVEDLHFWEKPFEWSKPPAAVEQVTAPVAVETFQPGPLLHNWRVKHPKSSWIVDFTIWMSLSAVVGFMLWSHL